MKKTYIQPETIVVNLHTEGMIAASIGFDSSDNKVDASSALTNKKNPIWGGEEEETSGGMW
jgi:hypothetical protein